MAIERSASHLQALIHIRLKSTLVNLSKGDGFSMIDGIHQLNVFPELSICCHTSSFCVCRITGQLDYPVWQFSYEFAWLKKKAECYLVNITCRKKLGPYAQNIVSRTGFGYMFEE